MLNRALIVFAITLSLLVGQAITQPASAQGTPGVDRPRDYTPDDAYTPPPRETREERKARENPCTNKDKQLIKRFNATAKRHLRKHAELSDSVMDITNVDDAEKMREEMEPVQDFFTNDKYDSMRPIYKRCNAPMPNLGGQPFWSDGL